MRSRFLPLALCLLAAARVALGQGSLTPPGAPGPTMRRLDQIEARTPIAGGSTPVTIGTSGSYYLTGNLTVASGDAITITAQNVALDLNGFTVATTATTPTGTAILIANVRISVCNGFIYGPGGFNGSGYGGGGFVNGVGSAIPTCEGVTVRELSISGCSTYGIKLVGNGYAGSRIERCIADNTGTVGIAGSIVLGCASYNCAGTAISAEEVSDSSGSGGTTGISARNATNCEGRGETGPGINCSGNARGCTGTSMSGIGLSAINANACSGSTQSTSSAGLTATTATGSYGFSVGGVGLYALTASTCRASSSTGIGLQVNTGTDCIGDTATGPYGVYGNVLTNSQGIATGGSGTGLRGFYTATNCLGISQGGTGLQTTLAVNCYGQTSRGDFSYAIDCGGRGVATGCYGVNTAANTTVLNAHIATSCSFSLPSTGVGVDYRYNQPNN